MVTLLIVGMTLLLVLQGMFTARETAFYTHQRKVARELAILSLGRVAAGLFWEELDERNQTLAGNYSEEGYDAFSWEIVLGDDDFRDNEQNDDGYFDNYAYRRYQESQNDDDEEEEAEEPFERVKVRVIFPVLGTERPNELLLEQWIPWTQVYGQSEEDAESEEAPQ